MTGYHRYSRERQDPKFITYELELVQELFIYSIIFIYLFDLFSLQVRSYSRVSDDFFYFTLIR